VGDRFQSHGARPRGPGGPPNGGVFLGSPKRRSAVLPPMAGKGGVGACWREGGACANLAGGNSGHPPRASGLGWACGKEQGALACGGVPGPGHPGKTPHRGPGVPVSGIADADRGVGLPGVGWAGGAPRGGPGGAPHGWWGRNRGGGISSFGKGGFSKFGLESFHGVTPSPTGMLRGLGVFADGGEDSEGGAGAQRGAARRGPGSPSTREMEGGGRAGGAGELEARGGR